MIKLAQLLALGVLLAAPLTARAEDHPCKADHEKYCKGIKPGDGKLAQCMKEHEKDLSPACKKKMAERKEDVKEVHEACHPDVEKHCKAVKPGGGRILACLKQNEAKLSDPCKKALADTKHAK